MELVTGKVYKLTETVGVDYHGYSPRSFVARFEGTQLFGDPWTETELRHRFLISDGRTADLMIEDWEVEEGSELLWALG
jgi:hypothetical protein